MEFVLRADKIKDISYFLNKIKAKDEQYKIPEICFFLGAGCSATSGIPTGSGIIEICKKFSFVENHKDGYLIDINERDKHLIYLEKIDEFIENRLDEFDKYCRGIENKFYQNISKDYILGTMPSSVLNEIREKNLAKDDSELKEKIFDLFSNTIHKDLMYSNWFEEYSQDTRGRQKLIESIIEQQKISGEYIVFANLIDQGLIHNIFTTNFDDIIYESLILYTNKKARVYSHNEQAYYIGIGSRKPNIIKLHGDYLFENIKNVSNETGTLEKNMEFKFKETLKTLGLAVVGYSGSDVSIMRALESVKKERNFPLYWFGSDENSINWRVVDLINNTSNSYFIRIKDFSTLVLKLWSVDKKVLKNIVEVADERQKEMENYLNDYNKAVQSNDILSDEEKEDFDENIKLSELFNRAFKEKDIKRRIIIYTKFIEKDKSHAEVFNNRGLAFFRLFKYVEALDDMNEAIKINDSVFLYYANRAAVFMSIGECEEALEDVEKSLHLEAKYPNALAIKGSIMSKLGKVEAADKLFEAALKINPQNTDVLMNVSAHYVENGRYVDAIGVCEAIEKIGYDDMPALYNNFAVAYRKMQEYNKAIDYIDKAKAINSEHAFLYGTLALIYADMENRKGFYENLEIAFEKGCPVWNFEDDKAFNRFRNDEKLRRLFNKYKNKVVDFKKRNK